MKLLNFKVENNNYFGLAVNNYALSFDFLQNAVRKRFPYLASMTSYLNNLPQSFESAMTLQETATQLIAGEKIAGMNVLSGVKILPPLAQPTALMDCGLSPRHLVNSMKTMMKHEFGSIAGRLISFFLKNRIIQSCHSDTPPYYKGNHLSIIGDGDEIGWPTYTSYLDIEPELAIVIGNGREKIAGYVIFNDASARDVQFPEMIGAGPARSKDFARGNGLGPFLVTPDEIADPLSLSVVVNVGERYIWKGSTSEYSARPEKLVDYFETISPLLPGTVLGMGTIPGCTGMDNDLWLLPGDLIKISFEKMGTLRQIIPDKLPKLESTRWKARPELDRFIEP